MKKKLFAISLAAITLISTLTGCGNYDAFDTVYTYRYGIIKLANGEIIEGRVESWTDYEGEQLQVKINGETYLVHSVNCTLMVNKE